MGDCQFITRCGWNFCRETVSMPSMETPNLEAQRAAMKKLAFLVGKWSGEASVLRGPREFVDLWQTEEAQFKLDGLLLIIEGAGRLKSDGVTERLIPGSRVFIVPGGWEGQ